MADTLHLAQRIETATPPDRDRAVDALRVIAIAGVVLGHWLVTALVSTGTGSLADDTPLATMPSLAPASWLFQTLSIFFLVGGYAAAKSRHTGETYRTWLRRRLARLARPLPAFALTWIPLALVLWLSGLTVHTLGLLLVLAVSPLWFLAVHAGLTALTPVADALWQRYGMLAVMTLVTVVGLVDLARLGLGGPVWIGWANLAAGWLVPYLMGIAWARGASTRPAVLLLAGALATALLIRFGGYPAAMVGVPGHRISNLSPPTLVSVTFGLAQTGLALLLRGPLTRLMRRPLAWAAVVTANLSAMTIFLWHQTAMAVTTIMLLAFGELPGLHTAPSGVGWVAERLLWLPVFGCALTGFWAVFRRYERAG